MRKLSNQSWIHSESRLQVPRSIAAWYRSIHWSSSRKLVPLLRYSTFAAGSWSLFQSIDDRRVAYCGIQTLSFRFDCRHLAPVSWCSLNLQIHQSAPVCWCSKIECHLVATLENVLLGLGCCFAPVSWRSMKQNSDPTPDSPECSKHLNLAERFFFALRRFLDTKLIGLGFATSEPSLALLSWALLDITLSELSSTWCSALCDTWELGDEFSTLSRTDFSALVRSEFQPNL